MYLAKTCMDQTPGSGSPYQSAGLGCAGGCGCGGQCTGMGFFDSGLDPSGWGVMEWGAVVIGSYVILSTVFTTRRAVSRVRALPGERRKRRAAEYRRRAAELSRR
jgi:hypothetical protein